MITYDVSRQPPDDQLVEIEYCVKKSSLARSSLGKWRRRSAKAVMSARCPRALRFRPDQDAPLPWFLLERMTIKTFTPMMDRAVAAVPKSAAGCRQRVVSG
jgi:hypothetical protein